jgi:hypothetical protein
MATYCCAGSLTPNPLLDRVEQGPMGYPTVGECGPAAVSVARLTAQKSHELIDGESGIGDDPSEGALPDLLVVRYDNTPVRDVATKDHMAPLLAAEDEAGAFQRGTDLAPGQTGGELGHPRGHGIAADWLCGFDLDEFLAGFGGDRITGIAAILQIELNGLADVGQGFGPRVALTDTPGQSRNANHVSPVGFPLQDNRVAHW